MNESTYFNISTSEEDECDFAKHKWLLIKFVLTSVIGSCVAVVGVAGNSNIIAVLTLPNMRTPNNLFLTALAVFDIAVLVSAVLLYSIEYVQEYFDDADMYLIWIDYVPYLYALSNFAQTGSVYITVSVTFERYLAVVQPRIAQSQCTRSHVGLIIFTVTGFAAAFNMSKFFEVEIVRNENCTGFPSRSLAPSSLLMDPLYNKVYTLWLTQFVMVFFPFGVLLTVNTAIVWNFRKSLKKLRCEMVQMDRGVLKRRSRDATRVLVTIVMVFLICDCWGFVITLMESIYGARELSQWAPEFYAFSREAINFLAIVNSSINFIVCVTFSDEFRHELLALYGMRRGAPYAYRHSLRRRRNGFSRRKSASRGSIIGKVGGVFRLRYVDRLNSLGSLMNGSADYGDGRSVPGASFSALVNAARNLINGAQEIDLADSEDTSYRKDNGAVQAHGSRDSIEGNNDADTGISDETLDAQQPFLRAHDNSCIEGDFDDADTEI